MQSRVSKAWQLWQQNKNRKTADSTKYVLLGESKYFKMHFLSLPWLKDFHLTCDNTLFRVRRKWCDEFNSRNVGKSHNCLAQPMLDKQELGWGAQILLINKHSVRKCFHYEFPLKENFRSDCMLRIMCAFPGQRQIHNIPFLF